MLQLAAQTPGLKFSIRSADLLIYISAHICSMVLDIVDFIHIK